MVVINKDFRNLPDLLLFKQHSDCNLPMSTCAKNLVQSGQSLSKFQCARIIGGMQGFVDNVSYEPAVNVSEGANETKKNIYAIVTSSNAVSAVRS